MVRAELGASITACTKADLLLAVGSLTFGANTGDFSAVCRSTSEIFSNVFTPKISSLVMHPDNEKLINSSSKA